MHADDIVDSVCNNKNLNAQGGGYFLFLSDNQPEYTEGKAVA